MDAIQDLISDNHCYGCGIENDRGLQIKSVWVDETHTQTTCTYQPLDFHCAGPTHIVNGGVLATVIDCHCVCTAIAKGYLEQGRAVGEGERVWFATGTLNVVYRAPAMLEHPLVLTANIVEVAPKKIVLNCEVVSDGVTVCTADVVAVKVPNAWFEGDS